MDCNICSSKFSTVQNFRRHVKRFHSAKYTELVPKQTSSSSHFKCSLCNVTFTRSNGLKRHIEKFHPGEDQLIPKKIRKGQEIKCDKCDKFFIHRNNLNIHKRSVHEDLTRVSNFQHKCVFCGFTDKTKHDIVKHYEENHNVVLEFEELNFENEIKFKNWKKLMEEETSTSFTKTYIFNDPKNGFEKLKFVCNRSGYYKPKGKRLRKLKSQGSLKIDGICPAEIEVDIHNDDKHFVKYLKSHCGHKNDYKDNYLTEEQKESIALKIAAGIPYRVILDEVRDSIGLNTKLEKNHLISRKDLYNIARSFQLQNESRVPVDGVNIEDWVKEMSNIGSVIYYKLKGSFCNICINLLEDDFVLIIMNQGQSEMLEKHASNCICVDRTNHLNADKMELISLLIADDNKKGFPCAFLISNRIDADTITLFYTCIKRKIGKCLETDIFMSDLEETFYSSWLKVMGTPQHRFFCPWHVEITWRNDLQKIKSRKLQSTVYENLKFLQQEKNEEDFDCCLDDFLETFIVKETLDFSIHFQQKFLDNRQSWAQYYKTKNNITLSDDLQTVHEEISKLYVFGKNNNRLILAVTAIMNYVGNRLFKKILENEQTSEIEEQIEGGNCQN